MKKKIDELDKSYIKLFGYKFETKTFWITMGVAVGALLFLVALTLLGVGISWYGVCFGLGFLMALALAGQNCKERDIHEDYPFSLIWWIFPLSIVGARLYFLAFDEGGISSFMDIISIWEGGLAIYGGVIGGALGLVICCLIKKVSIISTTDVVVPLLSLGQAFGRIGCIFGKCCYGVEVTNKALHWFPIALNINGDYYYATNFYESILDLGLFFLLTYLLRKTKVKGLTTCAYLVGYGVVRFVLEYFRAKEQTLYLLGFPVSQLVSIGCMLIGLVGICVILFVNNRKNKTN